MPIYTSTGNTSADILSGFLRKVIRKAIDENAMVFMFAPDFIVGEDTLYNMVKLAEGKDINIAIPHLRVALEDFVEDKQSHSFTNKQLVDLVFRYPHPAFTKAFDSKDENASWCGLSIRKINDRNYGIVASMPTMHLMQFTEEDRLFWKNHFETGHWDRGFLNRVYNADRVRMIGSSDIGFIVELTSKHKNNPKIRNGLLNNDILYQECKDPPGSHNFGFRKFYFNLARS